MSEVTLEKIDIVRERCGSSYSDAKDALDVCEGNVVDAIIYLEKNCSSKKKNMYATSEEFISWLKEVVNKGNVTRIKIKNEDKVVVDIPVTAGVVVGLVSIVWLPLIPILTVAAVAGVLSTKFTIEITKDDGSVEVVDKFIKTTVGEVKNKVNDITSDIREKFTGKRSSRSTDNENMYQYTVTFEEVDDEKSTEK